MENQDRVEMAESREPKERADARVRDGQPGSENPTPAEQRAAAENADTGVDANDDWESDDEDDADDEEEALPQTDRK